MKTRTSFRKTQNPPSEKLPLFLGLKLTGELRILMRLAANAQTDGANGASY